MPDPKKTAASSRDRQDKRDDKRTDRISERQQMNPVFKFVRDTKRTKPEE